MYEVVLAIFFVVNGEPMSHPDFPPYIMPDMLTCQERLAAAEEYFGGIEGFPEHEIGCYRKMEGSPT
jgi:hypothetical protein